MNFFSHRIFKKYKRYYIYVAILVVFIIWMTFLDTHSWVIHSELNDEIDKLERQKELFEKTVKEDKIMIEKLQNKDSLERFAREHYGLKKEDETVFYIEFRDSVP